MLCCFIIETPSIVVNLIWLIKPIGLKVVTNHLDQIKRKFVIGRITKPANQASFSCDGKEVTVADYMKEKYNITLR